MHIKIKLYLLYCCLVPKSRLTLLRPHGLWSASLLYPWAIPGKNTRVRSYFLLQGIFLTHGSNPCLLHWQADSLPLSHKGSPSFILLHLILYMYNIFTVRTRMIWYRYFIVFPCQSHVKIQELVFNGYVILIWMDVLVCA